MAQPCADGFKRRPCLQTELGPELWCSKCREFWPGDAEFFYMSKGKPHSWCKACYLEDLVKKGRRKCTGTVRIDPARPS